MPVEWERFTERFGSGGSLQVLCGEVAEQMTTPSQAARNVLIAAAQYLEGAPTQLDRGVYTYIEPLEVSEMLRNCGSQTQRELIAHELRIAAENIQTP